MPYVDEFPLCCGASVFTDFFGRDGKSLKASEVRKWLKKNKNVKDGEWEDGTGYNAFQCAILTKEQKKELHRAFVDHGFKLVGQGINGLHNSKLYFYLRTQNKEIPIPQRDEWLY